MTRFINGRTTVLAGHGFDDATGPYLLVNDVDAREQHRFAVRGRTFSLRRLPRRRCVGRFDLATYEKSCCPLNVELLPDAKETMCPACIEATGFNPSFYYADFVSPKQRAYNLTPHFAYLAYFSPQHVKAGISSETRGIERLLEQGARAARIVGRFSCADEARELEAALCAQPGILETMRASLKTLACGGALRPRRGRARFGRAGGGACRGSRGGADGVRPRAGSGSLAALFRRAVARLPRPAGA
ncbi:MAG TPA: DUF2797 domain-containing protein [Rubneribacter badeniensis]|uniref:DUF2797 domain-containing protein n=1 Tax=Rubneribacter badeniensis TaxID=2070688 RepID=A0A9D2VLY9_9ACTN|nr:DUF2797 domain-containing protein [Rubneribacter badeniensis]